MADRFLPWRFAWVVYNLVLAVALLAASPVWIPWMFFARKRRNNFLARLGVGVPRITPEDGSPSFLIHAVSVGETLAAVPFVRALKSRTPSASITLSTVTLTGQETARKTLGDTVSAICFFPFDLPFICRRFLDRVRPDAVVILETEIWPNLLAECATRNIPVVILNGRMSERSLKGYLRLSPLFCRVLANVSAIGAQSDEDARRYAELRGSALGVLPTGNMKYDMEIPAIAPELSVVMSQVRDSGGRWLVAGSTHEGEEEAVLSGFQEARRSNPSLRLLLAPRHPERFEKVERICAGFGLPVARKTTCGGNSLPENITVLLLDTVGELSGAYALADIAFVGGSLVPIGGHNILEPASFAVPIMTGIHMHNFRDMAALFRKADAVAIVPTPEAFGAVLSGLLDDFRRAKQMGDRGRELMRACQGATARNVSLVLESLIVAPGVRT